MNSIIDILNKGGVIAIPTDTVYGLVCDATNPLAVDKIYSIKGRDIKKPISIFVDSINKAYRYIENTDLNDKTVYLMKKYWPGALTIIFKRKNNVLESLNKDNQTIGIRIPNDNRLLDILKSVDYPLAQTSCNKSGDAPYVTYEEIKENLGEKVNLIVKYDNMIINNVASTIIDVSDGGFKVIRHGDVSEKEGFKS